MASHDTSADPPQTSRASTAEFFGNCQYGYDVRCELVGSRGTASLLNRVAAARMTDGSDVSTVPWSWRERFNAAYQTELQDWIHGLERGEIVGPSAWDGYAATRVTAAGIEAIQTGRRVEIHYDARHQLYD